MHVFGISRDSPWSHAAWQQSLAVDVPLLSDWDGRGDARFRRRDDALGAGRVPTEHVPGRRRRYGQRGMGVRELASCRTWTRSSPPRARSSGRRLRALPRSGAPRHLADRRAPRLGRSAPAASPATAARRRATTSRPPTTSGCPATSSRTDAAPWLDAYEFQPEAPERVNPAGWPLGIVFWPLEQLLGVVLAWNLLGLAALRRRGRPHRALAACARGLTRGGGRGRARLRNRAVPRGQSTEHLLGPLSVAAARGAARLGAEAVRARAARAGLDPALGPAPPRARGRAVLPRLRARPRDASPSRPAVRKAAGRWASARWSPPSRRRSLVRQATIEGSVSEGGRSLDSRRPLVGGGRSTSLWREPSAASSSSFAYPRLADAGRGGRRGRAACALAAARARALVLAAGRARAGRARARHEHAAVRAALARAAAAPLPARPGTAAADRVPLHSRRSSRSRSTRISVWRGWPLAAGRARGRRAAARRSRGVPVRAFRRGSGEPRVRRARRRPEGRILELPVFRPELHYGSVYQLYALQTAARAAGRLLDRRRPRRRPAPRRHCGRSTAATGAAARQTLLQRLGVSAILVHAGLFEANPSVPPARAFAEWQLSLHDWRPLVSDGDVTLWVRGRSRIAAPPRAARLSCGRGGPVWTHRGGAWRLGPVAA